MNSSPSDDDAVIVGPAAGAAGPVHLLFSQRGIEPGKKHADELLTANNQLLGAMADVRELQSVISEGGRQMRAATSRIVDLESRVASLQRDVSERRATVAVLERQRDRAEGEAVRLRAAIEEALNKAALAERRVEDVTIELQVASARAVRSEKLADRQAARAAGLESKLAEAAGAFGALEAALDAALFERSESIRAAEESRVEADAWVRECEALLVQADAARDAAAELEGERQLLLATLKERNAELLSWLETAEQLNNKVLEIEARGDAQAWRERAEALQAGLDGAREDARASQERAIALDDELKAVKEDRHHWHGRSEALEVHLSNARREGAERAAELEGALNSEKQKSERLESELTGLANRFTRFAQVEAERTRNEITHISTAISAIQSGRVWTLKYWLRRISGRR